MKVILIGYRASGKTTVGQHLSNRLKIPFVDTDRLIEEAAGMPVKDLVAREGWDIFREKEKEAVASLQSRGFCVVATGGGAVLSEDNRRILKNRGIVVYLQTPSEDILERLTRDVGEGGTRPQFTEGSLAEETQAVLAGRIPIYESAADITVDTGGKSIVRVAEEIYEHLLERGVVWTINQAKKNLKK